MTDAQYMAALGNHIDASGGVSAAAMELGVNRESIRRAIKAGKPGRKLRHLLDARAPGLHSQDAPEVDGGGTVPPASPAPVAPPPAEPEPEPEQEPGKPFLGLGDVLTILAAGVGFSMFGPAGAIGGALLAEVGSRVALESPEDPKEEPTSKEYNPRRSRPQGGAPTRHDWTDPP